MKQTTGTCVTCGRGPHAYRDVADCPYLVVGERSPMCGPCRRAGRYRANYKLTPSAIPVMAPPPMPRVRVVRPFARRRFQNYARTIA